MLSDNAPNFFAVKKAYGRAKRLLEQLLEDLAWHIHRNRAGVARAVNRLAPSTLGPPVHLTAHQNEERCVAAASTATW